MHNIGAARIHGPTSRGVSANVQPSIAAPSSCARAGQLHPTVEATGITLSHLEHAQERLKACWQARVGTRSVSLDVLQSAHRLSGTDLFRASCVKKKHAIAF